MQLYPISLSSMLIYKGQFRYENKWYISKSMIYHYFNSAKPKVGELLLNFSAMPRFLNASKYCGKVLKSDFVIVVVGVADELLSYFQRIGIFRKSCRNLSKTENCCGCCIWYVTKKLIYLSKCTKNIFLYTNVVLPKIRSVYM